MHNLLDDTIQLYIDCVYSSENYRKEVYRLLSYGSGKFGSRGNDSTWNYTDHVISMDTGFNYPAIVSVYFDEEGCMYALLDEPADRIIYVYLQFENIMNIQFDRSYLPIDENGEPTTLYYLPF